MKRIRYAGGEIVTGDAVASAVLDYAAALANSARAERVEVPVADPDVGTVELLIGPASQVFAEPIEGGDFDDEEFADELHRLIEDSRRTWTPSTHASSVSDWDL